MFQSPSSKKHLKLVFQKTSLEFLHNIEIKNKSTNNPLGKCDKNINLMFITTKRKMQNILPTTCPEINVFNTNILQCYFIEIKRIAKKIMFHI